MAWRTRTGILAQDNLKIGKALLLVNDIYARVQMEFSASRWICSDNVDYSKTLANVHLTHKSQMT